MAKGAVGAARIEMTVNSASFEKQMKRAEDATSRYQRSLKNAERQFKKMGAKLERLGGKMSRSLTLPLASAGVAVVKAAGDFEQSFADIEKTVTATPEQFARISKEMRQMAKEIPTSVNELNRMAGVAGQLGVNAENIAEFTRVIAMLGDTTDIAGEQAALSLSRFMNVMGTAEGDIDRIGATIVGLGNNFAAMESEIVNIATSMAPLGNSIGLTEQQILAFSTAIAASGGEAQAATTAFQKAGNTMQLAVIEGNENLRIFAETAGVSAAKFQQHFQEDAAGALQLFMRGLQRIQEEGGSMVSVLDKIGLADQRLIREFGKVIGNLDQLDAALGQANTEWQRNTALTEEAQKRYQTFNSRLSILWNRIIDFSITIGNVLIPTINKLIDVTSKVTEWFGKLNERTIKIGVAVMGLIAAIGPAVFILGKVVTAVKLIFTALIALKTPIALVIAGIAGLIVVGKNVVDNFSVIALELENIWDGIKVVATGLTRAIVKSFGWMFQKIIGVMKSVASVMQPTLVPALAGIDQMIQNTMDGVDKSFDDVKEQFKQSRIAAVIARGEMVTLGESFGSLAGYVTGAAGSLWDYVNAMMTANSASNNADNILQNAQPDSIQSIQGRTFRASMEITPPDVQRVTGAFDTMTDRMSRFSEKSRQVSEEFANSVTPMIATAVADMAESFIAGIAKMAVEGGSLQNIFHSVMGVLADLAIRVGKIAIGIGIAIEGIKKALQSLNPVAAIAAGIGLIALGAYVRSALSNAANNAGAGGSETSVNDALIRSDGSVVRFHPDDDILAMKDFSKLGLGGGNVGASAVNSAGAGKIYADISINLDSVQIWRGQKRLERRRNT